MLTLFNEHLQHSSISIHRCLLVVYVTIHGNFLLCMLPCYGNKCFFVFLIKLTIIRLFCLFLHTDKRYTT